MEVTDVEVLVELDEDVELVDDDEVLELVLLEVDVEVEDDD